jgi:sugar lactone lactonase YvrE
MRRQGTNTSGLRDSQNELLLNSEIQKMVRIMRKDRFAFHDNDSCFNILPGDIVTTNPIAHSTSISRANTLRQRARHVSLLLTTGFMAITLTACGGGGGGGNPPPTPPTSSISVFAGNPTATGAHDGPVASAQFNVPTGVAADLSGNLYVADFENDTIRKISAGNVSTFAGTANTSGSADGTGAAASFSGPSNIAISPAGNLYVTDQGSEAVTVRKITSAGQVTTLVDPRTNQALQTDGSTVIATDAASNLYLFTTQASTGASMLTQVTPTGAVNLITLTSPTGAPIGLINPSGVTVDSANNVYIADDNTQAGAGVLYKVAINGANGQVTTLAGSIAIAGSSDGPGNAATFDGLSTLAVDPAGNIFAGTPEQYGLNLGPLPGTLPAIDQLAWLGQSLYVADTDDSVILKLSPAP